MVKKAVYIVIGINLDGGKDVLGMWVGENESAKFWTTVLNSLCNHGGEDIFIACTDNLAGPSMLSFLRPRPSVHSFPPALPQFWKFEVVRLEHFPVAKV
ncbi:MAG: transposase [Ruthenibacterium lactatiformans]